MLSVDHSCIDKRYCYDRNKTKRKETIWKKQLVEPSDMNEQEEDEEEERERMPESNGNGKNIDVIFAASLFLKSKPASSHPSPRC